MSAFLCQSEQNSVVKDYDSVSELNVMRERFTALNKQQKYTNFFSCPCWFLVVYCDNSVQSIRACF